MGLSDVATVPPIHDRAAPSAFPAPRPTLRRFTMSAPRPDPSPRRRRSRPLIASTARPHARGGRRLTLGRRPLGLVVLAATLLAGPAAAVLIDVGDGSGNTTPPVGDPGFAHVGVMGGLTGVYVRNGWALTADHVGAGPITLLGQTYQPIAGSTVRFENPDGTPADLIAFKLTERPPLPDLALASGPMARNTLLTLVGNGRNRGAATRWMGIDGWLWGAGRALRWGTNRVGEVGMRSLDTESFWVYFDDLPGGGGGGQSEADVVNGDSGGAAFEGTGPGAELVGILFARAGFMDQPEETSLYGNAGLIADLWFYRDEIVAVIDQPDCSDGIDDDGDGLVDHPDDPGCSSPTDASERELTLACDNALDDDGDGTIDLGDPGCDWPGDTNERGAVQECDNGIDDDGDDLADFPLDPGCLHPSGLYELPESGFGIGLALGVAALAGARRVRSAPRSL